MVQTYSTRRILGVLLAIFVVLLAANVLVITISNATGDRSLGSLMPFFHFDHENNPPTCYSALLHLMCALLTGLAARSAPFTSVVLGGRNRSVSLFLVR